MIWAEMASPALGGGDGAVALWPIGATEQHGPHLPCGTDADIAGAVCRAAARQVHRAVVLPTLPIGCSAAHTARWPGTLSLTPRTLIAVVVEVVGWAVASGWSRLLLVNGHVGNSGPLRAGLDEARWLHSALRIGLVNTWELSPSIRAVFTDDAEDWHANAAETSVMLALAPELVGDHGSADDPDRTPGAVFAWNVAATSRNGVTGRPSQASAARGQALFEEMARALADLARRAASERSPLEVDTT